MNNDKDNYYYNEILLKKEINIKNKNNNNNKILWFSNAKHLLFNKTKTQIDNVHNECSYSLKDINLLNEINKNKNKSFYINKNLINKNDIDLKMKNVNISNNLGNDLIKASDYKKKIIDIQVVNLSKQPFSENRINADANNNVLKYFNNKKTVRQLLEQQNNFQINNSLLDKKRIEKPITKSVEYRANENLDKIKCSYFCFNYNKEGSNKKKKKITTKKIVKEINSLLIPKDKTFELLQNIINERIKNKKSLNNIDDECFINQKSDKYRFKSIEIIFKDIIKKVYKKMLKKGYDSNSLIKKEEIMKEYYNQIKTIKTDLEIFKITKDKKNVSTICHNTTTGRNYNKYFVKLKNLLINKEKLEKSDNKNKIFKNNSCNKTFYCYNVDGAFKKMYKKKYLMNIYLNQNPSSYVNKTFFEKNIIGNYAFIKKYMMMDNKEKVVKKKLNDSEYLPKNNKCLSSDSKNKHENEVFSSISSTKQNLSNSQTLPLNLKNNLNNKMKESFMKKEYKEKEDNSINEKMEKNKGDMIKIKNNKNIINNNNSICSQKNFPYRINKKHINQDILKFLKDNEIEKEQNNNKGDKKEEFKFNQESKHQNESNNNNIPIEEIIYENTKTIYPSITKTTADLTRKNMEIDNKNKSIYEQLAIGNKKLLSSEKSIFNKNSKNNNIKKRGDLGNINRRISKRHKRKTNIKKDYFNESNSFIHAKSVEERKIEKNEELIRSKSELCIYKKYYFALLKKYFGKNKKKIKSKNAFQKYLEKEKEEKNNYKTLKKESSKNKNWENKFDEFKKYISKLKQMDHEEFRKDALKCLEE